MALGSPIDKVRLQTDSRADSSLADRVKTRHGDVGNAAGREAKTDILS